MKIRLLKEMVTGVISEASAMWNIYVYRNGAWAKGNKKPMTQEEAAQMELGFKKIPSVQQVEIKHIKDAERLEKRRYYIDSDNEKDYTSLNKKTTESNLREVSDFKIDGTSLKQYQSMYPNFKFSTDVDMYGNKQLVADVPKRKQEIKFYVWNGKINAQVTNGGLSNHATLDDALDHLYRQYGTTAPSSK